MNRILRNEESQVRENVGEKERTICVKVTGGKMTGIKAERDKV